MTTVPKRRYRQHPAIQAANFEPVSATAPRELSLAFEDYCSRLKRSKSEQLRRLMLSWVRERRRLERLRDRQAGGRA